MKKKTVSKSPKQEHPRWSIHVLNPAPPSELQALTDLLTMNMLDRKQLSAFKDKHRECAEMSFERLYELKSVARALVSAIRVPSHWHRIPIRKAFEVMNDRSTCVMERRASAVATLAGHLEAVDTNGHAESHPCDRFAYELVYDHVNSANGWPHDVYPPWPEPGFIQYLELVSALGTHDPFYNALICDLAFVRSQIAKVKSCDVSLFYCIAALTYRVGAFGAPKVRFEDDATELRGSTKVPTSAVNGFRDAWKAAGSPVDKSRRDNAEGPPTKSRTYMLALSALMTKGPLRRKAEYGPHPSDRPGHAWTPEQIDAVVELVGWRGDSELSRIAHNPRQ